MPDILDRIANFQRHYDGKIVVSDPEQKLTRAGLAARVAAGAAALLGHPARIGLIGDNSVEWVVAQLAGWCAGKTMVPLPSFFSPMQLRHLTQDSGISHVIACGDYAAKIHQLGLTPIGLSRARQHDALEIVPGGGQIIYTSGSTGAPKGVMLSLPQIDFSAKALVNATGAHKSDVYLSLLPLPLLLETISAICVPILAGASTVFEPLATRALADGTAASVGLVIERHRPTATVLVPQVLNQWVAQLESMGTVAPDGLRFVAVGGAPLAASLAEKAWKHGIPVHEGYGLSECCSVVAMNRPGARAAGTVGRVLDGLDVLIDNGEICVKGPTVMRGYVSGGAVGDTWRTGDLGHWDRDGNLVVDGRKDNLIVTAGGRNISPEWIEAMIAADARVLAVAVIGHGEPELTAVVVPSHRGASWFGMASRTDTLDWLAVVCGDAPAYAVPQRCIVIGSEDAVGEGLLTSNGRIRRPVAMNLARSAETVTVAA